MAKGSNKSAQLSPPSRRSTWLALLALKKETKKGSFLDYLLRSSRMPSVIQNQSTAAITADAKLAAQGAQDGMPHINPPYIRRKSARISTGSIRAKMLHVTPPDATQQASDSASEQVNHGKEVTRSEGTRSRDDMQYTMDQQVNKEKRGPENMEKNGGYRI
ncbi:uncharacterized protein EV420DRAFT_1484025 [Desarmillaria tabescens]|uniref:Uncharacterized protein n=1 Tax=Armillaria tabescens TaxID=1929756 RepID=A0AA39MTI9_ARMTA|nr:uncharacterized protein EV420DRAFT_1484025 [Desarmillaria tabescens]KAK0446596.1 hypothetical protein EV420DRAFT_1484025 [Desarmillaria tabescens]